VVIDIPKDITRPDETFPYHYPESVKLRSYSPAVRGHSGQIRKAARLLLSARRPVIYSGGGVIQGEACDELTELAKLPGLSRDEHADGSRGLSGIG
jgi:acetolactate synthase-1/2/3 large subunit